MKKIIVALAVGFVMAFAGNVQQGSAQSTNNYGPEYQFDLCVSPILEQIREEEKGAKRPGVLANLYTELAVCYQEFDISQKMQESDKEDSPKN